MERSSGILMPVSSLPSPYGIGTVGKAAYDFVDFLQEAGQRWWQILPVNPTTLGDSPYQGPSAFAGNPFFIDLDMLIRDGLLTQEEVDEVLSKLDGVVVPGGFGARGVEGKIKAAEYALTHNMPYLGLCLGMQTACIAAARIGGVENANSEEFGATEIDGNNVIYIMEGQKGKESTGGTMRLGDYKARLRVRSKTRKIYEKYGWGNMEDSDEYEVIERHRHRYEVNQKFLSEIEKGGLTVSGTSPNGKLVEFVEAPKAKFFVATQAHPEFKSRPLCVHPLFMEFVRSTK